VFVVCPECGSKGGHTKNGRYFRCANGHEYDHWERVRSRTGT
jgi:hypothetical protein